MFLAGIAGIGYQQMTERYYVPLLVIYGLMAGIPGIAQLALAALQAFSPEPPDDAGSAPDTPRSPLPSQVASSL